MVPTYMFRSEMGYTDLEKRQLFLRSYQFSRKQSVGERIRKSLFRVKRVVWVRLRSAVKLRRMLWLKLKNSFSFSCRRKRGFKIFTTRYSHEYGASRGTTSCFWRGGGWDMSEMHDMAMRSLY